MTGFKALTIAQLKGFVRNKQTIFWILLFPLMFLLIFGLLFSGSDGADKAKVATVGQVAILDQMPAEARAQIGEVFEFEASDDREAALEKVRKGDLDGMVEMRGNEVLLHYSAADQVGSARLQGIMSSIVNGSNLAVAQAPTTFTLKPQQVEDEGLKPIQYLVPGLLGWAVGMGGLFNVALNMVEWRRTKLMRRLRLSPARLPAIMTSYTVVTLITALAQTAIFLGVGFAFFGLKLTDQWWWAIPLLFLGSLAFMAIGMIVGGISKTPDAASGLANLLILPMAFLSGSFIPLEQAPSWMTTVSRVLPLGQLNNGMMDVMVRGEGVASLAEPALVLIAFTLVCGAIGLRLFRWDD